MADLNFINQIRDTEQLAADTVSQALENARQLQDNARQQAAEMIREARDAAALQQKALLADAAVQADRILEDARSQSAATAEARSDLAGEILEKAARQVAERIVSDNAHR